MHIPDGFLDAKTWISLDVISVGVLAYAIAKANKKIDEKHIPLMGVTAAFIFAAQMLNFPVVGGTSGHFVGGVLAAILLGPLAGTLVMSTVLIVQCLFFQDGGLMALGANIFNMGIVGAVGGYYIYLLLKKFLEKIKIKRGMLVSSFIASWFSVILASACCSIELAISGTVPFKVALPAMVSVHVLIGIGEGLITFFILAFLSRVRKDLLELQKI